MDELAPRLVRWFQATMRRAAWAPIVVFAVHLILAGTFHVYSRYPAFDGPMHFVGGFAIAYFALQTARAARDEGLLGAPNRAALMALGFTGACTLALVWEFYEFLSDRYLGTHTQGGLYDTFKDLALGIGGAITYLAMFGWRNR